MAKKVNPDISIRVAELRRQKGMNGFAPMFATLCEEGYKPEVAIMWLGEYLTFS